MGRQHSDPPRFPPPLLFFGNETNFTYPTYDVKAGLEEHTKLRQARTLAPQIEDLPKYLATRRQQLLHHLVPRRQKGPSRACTVPYATLVPAAITDDPKIEREPCRCPPQVSNHLLRKVPQVRKVVQRELGVLSRPVRAGLLGLLSLQRCTARFLAISMKEGTLHFYMMLWPTESNLQD